MMNIKALSQILLSTLLLICFLCNVSCSSQRVERSDSKIIVDSTPLNSDSPHKADAPKALNADIESEKNMQNSPLELNLSGLNYSQAFAGAALVGAIMGLSKVFKSNEPRNDLRGSCLYGDPDAPATSPCINVRVNLLGENKDILTSSSTNQYGQFRFYIPVNASYYVQIIDRKGRSSLTQVKLGRSEYIALFLKP